MGTQSSLSSHQVPQRPVPRIGTWCWPSAAAAVATLTKAMLTPDKARLEARTADPLSYGHSSGKVEDKARFVNVVTSKKTVYKSIELSKQASGWRLLARRAFKVQAFKVWPSAIRAGP